MATKSAQPASYTRALDTTFELEKYFKFVIKLLQDDQGLKDEGISYAQQVVTAVIKQAAELCNRGPKGEILQGNLASYILYAMGMNYTEFLYQIPRLPDKGKWRIAKAVRAVVGSPYTGDLAKFVEADKKNKQAVIRAINEELNKMHEDGTCVLKKAGKETPRSPKACTSALDTNCELENYFKVVTELLQNDIGLKDESTSYAQQAVTAVIKKATDDCNRGPKGEILQGNLAAAILYAMGMNYTEFLYHIPRLPGEGKRRIAKAVQEVVGSPQIGDLRKFIEGDKKNKQAVIRAINGELNKMYEDGTCVLKNSVPEPPKSPKTGTSAPKTGTSALNTNCELEKYFKFVIELLQKDQSLKEESTSYAQQAVTAVIKKATEDCCRGPEGEILRGNLASAILYAMGMNYTEFLHQIPRLPDKGKWRIAKAVQAVVGSPGTEDLTKFLEADKKNKQAVIKAINEELKKMHEDGTCVVKRNSNES